MRVLVTDAGFKNGLCAIRNLGQHDISVIAGSTHWFAQGFTSRYVSSRVLYPSPKFEDRFVTALLEAVRRHSVDVVLPIGDATTTTLSRHKAAFAGVVALPIAEWEAMSVACSKRQTIHLAQTMGVRVPVTYDSPEAVSRFPVVVKAVHGSGQVRYVNNEVELAEAVRGDVVIQEYVAGSGCAVFALFDRGVEKAVFMHRRIREYPVTGGASTAAESIAEPRLAELGLRLLRALKWHGVAMVEFKRHDASGDYVLMEINPKFWGSLDLAVRAGVEFPWLAVKMAMGEEIKPSSVRPGVRFQWVFDDFLHACARPNDIPRVVRDYFNPAIGHDIVLRDPLPAVFRAGTVTASLLIRLAKGTFRRPHGVPRRGGQPALVGPSGSK